MSLSYSSNLQQKLSVLKKQKQQQFYCSIWRSLIISSATATLLWLASLPYWQIKQKSQIKIVGNHTVTKDTIYSLLPLSYPQFIWSIPTKQLSQSLESAPPILDARVTRQILPPIITISLQEKVPVAIAFSKGKVGFLDAQGNWIPRQFYRNTTNNSSSLALRAINFQPQYAHYWREIYELINLYSNIDIFEVNWQDSENLRLKTELGMVYLGSPSFRLADKFAALARLQNLPAYLNQSQIDYIDLSNPDLRVIEKKPQENSISN
ncbi:MAG: FtsQ-type POTRA domain-containing protein [Xenococcaceae cyanobacterium MO_188.B29]|nr:FtsQ-type POTRA domain-containing protein [Xenococcaceae cyanobacterium MO_188.B29]